MCAYHNKINYSYYYPVNYLKVRDTISVIIFICTIYPFFYVLPFVSYYHFESLLTICNIRIFIIFLSPPLPPRVYTRYGCWRQIVSSFNYCERGSFWEIGDIFAFSFFFLFVLFHKTSPEYMYSPLSPELSITECVFPNYFFLSSSSSFSCFPFKFV